MRVFTRERRWRSAPAKRRPAEPAQASRRRIVALYVVVAAVFALLSLRLLTMQVIGGSEYRLQAEENRLKLVTMNAPRGLIYDRAGRQLVQNVAVFSVAVIPADLPRARQGEVFQALQALLGVPVYEIESRVARVRESADPFQPVLVKREIDHQTALTLAERRRSLPGVEVRYETTRTYEYGDVLAHVLGYAGRMSETEWAENRSKGYSADERVGKAGVELTYQEWLRGAAGRRQIEVDATGNEVRSLGDQAPKAGANITLSIDAELQRAIADILKQSTAGLGSRKSVAMVMDVNTGELLASVSLPTYDNNIFSYQVDDEEYAKLLNNPAKPLLNHAVAEKFAPGSTFKQITGLAALQEGVATTRTTITSRGTLLVAREDDEKLKDSFTDWSANLGTLDFYRGVAMSSDIYFYCLAGGHCETVTSSMVQPDGLGVERLARYARMFGFGAKTGIDLPGETAGLVGDPQWLDREMSLQWYLGDTFFMGIGQGYIEASPLQVLRMTATIANGGQLLKPRVVREVRDAGGGVLLPAKAEVVRRVDVNSQYLQAMRDAMRLAVSEGTANKAKVEGVTVAGKTGTAEFGSRLGAGSIYGRYKEHGWMTAFAPYEKPEIAVVVFNEEGSGANTAAPTTAKIIDYYFNQRPKLTQVVQP